MFRLNPNYGQEEGTIIVVRFETREAAKLCHETLLALFAEIEEKLSALFSAQGGEATIEDISRIYAGYGFQNDNGWHQSAPPVLEDTEVIWPLDGGASTEEAENILAAMEPLNVRVYSDREALEDWQRYPHPAVMPLPDDEDLFLESPVVRTNSGGRLLH